MVLKYLKTMISVQLSILIFICFSLKEIANAEIPIVTSSPTIIKQPQYEQLFQVAMTQDEKDNSFLLECEAQGNPKPEFRWKKNGIYLEHISYDKRISQQPKSGTLVFKKPEDIDEGLYQCFASNRYGTAVSNAVFVRKSGKTQITQPPDDLEVAAGSSATFHCKAEADPSLSLKIEWLFNGHLIDFDQNPRMVQTSDNSLMITKTRDLDSGIYSCIARTELDSDLDEATLIVQDVPNPPRIVSVKCDTTYATVVWQPMGDRGTPILSYSIQYNTSFSPETWEDVYKNISAAETSYKVTMSPWGNYTFRVRAYNKIGISEPSAPSEHCTTPEEVPFKNPDKVMGKGTHPNNLVISWTPMPLIEHNAPNFFYKVFWKRDDIPQDLWKHEIINDWRQNEKVINNQPTFKRYRIKVEAHNRRGQAKVPAEEVIGYSGEDVPTEAPSNFKWLYIIFAKTAFFIWNPVSPDTLRGHFRGYKIQTWTADESEEHLREVIVPNNVTEVHIDFRPYSRNFVRVCAYNDIYNGPPSDTIDLLTPEGTPGPISYFEAITMGASALYLIWKPPLEPNGKLTGYRIYYREINGTAVGPMLERQPRITNSRETRAKLIGLKPSTKYRVIIHATTKAGQGDPYYIEVKTNEQSENVPDVPNFVWALLPGEQGKASIFVTWVPAVEGHPGSYFYVQYRIKGEDHWNQTATEVNLDSVIVKGLEFGTLYEMRVVAVDGRFETPSRIVEIETGGLTAVRKSKDFRQRN